MNAPTVSPPSDGASAQAPGHPPRLYSMQGRLLALLLGILSVIWILVSLGTYQHNKQEVGHLLDMHLAQTANLLAAQPVDDIRDEEIEWRPLGDEETADHHRYRVPVIFQVWQGEQLLVRSAQAPDTPLVPPAQTTGFSTVGEGHHGWRAYALPGRERDVRIIVAERIEARQQIVRASVETLMVSLIVAYPLLALVLWWGLRRAMRPLTQIGRQIAGRTPQDHSPLAIDRMPREVAPLVQALNELFGRIGEMLQQERRFTADAAHELRTPIAAIRMMAQVAEGARTEPERATALAGVLQGCDRATRLVEQLLQLARLESDRRAEAAVEEGSCGAHPDVPQTVDVLPAMRQVVADLTATWAVPHHQTIAWEAPPALYATLTPALAAVLLRNLLDNALRYSPDGAQVQVTLCQEGADALSCTVEDSGPGMRDEDMQQLGKRFFRVLGNQATGSGLGWSIVQRIAALYGYMPCVSRSERLGGLKVTFAPRDRCAP